MDNSLDAVKEHLLATDEEFRLLAERHRALDEQLRAIETKTTRTTEDEIEEHRLKKLKLAAKDHMLERMSQQAQAV